MRLKAVFTLSLFSLCIGLSQNSTTAQNTAKPPQDADSSASKLDQASWESIFDGKTLDGWKGADGFWRVEDNAITGQTTAEKKLESNSFLIWQGGDIGDFELKLKFRMENGNSGIQFRSQDLGNFSVGGYQADIDSGKRFTGILYEERGRGILCERGQKVTVDKNGKLEVTGSTADMADFAKKVDESQWCEYHIRAVGNHITQSINGIPTMELHDHQTEKAKNSGILAFQIHVGPEMKVQFKDIELRQVK